jgi:signal transduction histidine kinase
LLNFTTNAIKYAHPDRYPEIIYTLAIEKNYTILEINDNGLGINLEIHGDKLFGMYKTFHNNANARGIGLFITKNQIEAMGGKVEVESKVNIGTTFKIYFNNEF